MLMMNGSMAIHTERESFLLHSDDILFVNANEPHCLQKTDAIGDVLVLQFPDTFCKTYYPLLGFCEFQDRYLTSCSHPQAHAKLYELTTDIAKQFCRRQNGLPASRDWKIESADCTRYCKTSGMRLLRKKSVPGATR